MRADEVWSDGAACVRGHSTTNSTTATAMAVVAAAFGRMRGCPLPNVCAVSVPRVPVPLLACTLMLRVAGACAMCGVGCVAMMAVVAVVAVVAVTMVAVVVARARQGLAPVAAAQVTVLEGLIGGVLQPLASGGRSG